MQQPFEQAVTVHGPTVLRVVRSVLGPGPDADDAWSETFLAALRAWPDLPEETNVQAWLVRVAHRKAIDVTRGVARRAVPTDILPEQPTSTGLPEAAHPDLWAAVAALPERQRLSLAYHYLGGLRHTETAELIGGTPESVRRAASDGLRALRRTYAPEGASR
ncbi:RNA polymerase sigma factor [Ornithinimicrobium cryptoxanthini]|uniref:Sigma-70 family RNA polymerase sigma factor n=1 Tax=Ornithinimicrobium cryptoxanthini TaxID=2934161 RepID=A0ABY4YFJ2_9MICO|nr:sigma-70 family RNA polymerase sigma factor [Ornithinimicrobium cryptoxanthini]USQ75123.1 sigma-70 family RNA polymerase sigma factor [Ornithinimicrobium cryptoxanthini]